MTRPKTREQRLGVESVYSLVGRSPGSDLKHQHVLMRLHELLGRDQARATTLEYLRRDLLNLVFGNSDNHGRNTSVLKTPTGVRLAPVYDFAPMMMDPEGVTRTTRWEEFEQAGEVDWPGLLKSFGKDEGFLRAGLKRLAKALVHLPELLEELALPATTLNFPPLALKDTANKLSRWTLL